MKPGLPESLRAFLAWWKSSLLELLPAGLGTRLAGGRELELILSEQDAELREEGKLVTRLTLPEGRLELLAGGLTERVQAGDRVSLCVPPSQVLMRRLDLPVSAEKNLGELLGYEMDTFTPFDARKVYFDYRLEQRNSATGTIQVQLYVLLREPLDALSAALAGRGARIGAVKVLARPADAAGRARPEPGVDLAPAAWRRAPRGGWRLAPYLVLALLLANLIYPFVGQYRLAQELEQEAAVLRQQLNELRKRNAGVYQGREAAAWILQRREEQARVMDVLDTLTRILPDHTHLSELSLKDGRIEITGSSAEASALPALIEAAGFVQARFTAAITPDPRSGAERFSLQMRLKPAPEERP